MKKIYILSLTCILLIILSIGGVLIYPHIEHILPRNSIFRRMLMSTEERNKKVMLVVAKHDYPKGTTITDPEQMFELRESLELDAPILAVDASPDSFLRGIEALRGAVLTKDIQEGQPLEHLSFKVPEPPSFAALMKEGKLEPAGPGKVYIPIRTAQAREDSIRVGTRVDVLENKFHDITDFFEIRPSVDNKKVDKKSSAKVQGGTWAGKRAIRKTNGDIKIIHRERAPERRLEALLHDVLVRAVLPAPFLQHKLDEDAEKNFVALQVLVETSTEEGQVFFASIKQYQEDRQGGLGTLERVEYTVLKEEGQWIMVQEKGVQGWARKEKFVLQEDAPAYFTQRIRSNPRNASAWFYRACAWDANGELDNAIKDFTEAIRLDPDATSYVGRGRAYGHKKDYDHAIADYTEAMRLDPKCAIAYSNRGVAHAYKKDYDRAIADFNEAIRLDPKDESAFYNKACCYALLGKKDLAIESLRQSLELGYSDFEHMEKDSDLDFIRNDPRYKALLDKYAK